MDRIRAMSDVELRAVATVMSGVVPTEHEPALPVLLAAIRREVTRRRLRPSTLRRKGMTWR